MTKTIGLLLLAAVAAARLGAGEHAACGAGSPVTKAVAVLSAASGSPVSGTLRFEVRGKDVRLQGVIRGLTPGDHGFHIHEFGDCSAPDAASAGGHYNPGGHVHGGPGSKERHVGDLGNVKAGKDGTAKVDRTLKGVDLSTLVGRSVIVHAQADDLKSQPAGNAGPRVGCGVIGIADVGTKKK
jgi:Cu-Zn family superoxide dismutase